MKITSSIKTSDIQQTNKKTVSHPGLRLAMDEMEEEEDKDEMRREGRELAVDFMAKTFFNPMLGMILDIFRYRCCLEDVYIVLVLVTSSFWLLVTLTLKGSLDIWGIQVLK